MLLISSRNKKTDNEWKRNSGSPLTERFIMFYFVSEQEARYLWHKSWLNAPLSTTRRRFSINGICHRAYSLTLLTEMRGSKCGRQNSGDATTYGVESRRRPRQQCGVGQSSRRLTSVRNSARSRTKRETNWSTHLFAQANEYDLASRKDEKGVCFCKGTLLDWRTTTS